RFFREHCASLLPAGIRRDRDDLDVFSAFELSRQALQRGQLLHTGRARHAPKIQDDELAAMIAQLPDFAVSGLESEVRRQELIAEIMRKTAFSSLERFVARVAKDGPEGRL